MKKKCCYCKQLINNEELFQFPKKDRQGNIKYNKNGSTQNYNCHKACYEDKQKKYKQWCELFEYIKSIYFNKNLPPYLISELQTFRNKYDFDVMLKCLMSIELYLKNRVLSITFENDIRKSNYILSALKNNIDGFYEKYLKNKSTFKKDNVIFIEKKFYDDSKINNKPNNDFTNYYDFLD